MMKYFIWSDKAAEFCGHAIYKIDGREIPVTAVYERENWNDHYKWDDAKLITTSENGTWLRSHNKTTYPLSLNTWSPRPNEDRAVAMQLELLCETKLRPEITVAEAIQILRG